MKEIIYYKSGVVKLIEETSAGGVVIFRNTILLLKKFNGDWVLPKGRIEKDETVRETAIREVLEESGVKAKIVKYIGMVHYKFKNTQEDDTVYKTVHWYVMKTNSMDCTPQKKEGFIDARFVHMDKAEELVRYEDEKKIILKSLRIMKM